jgi:hypothetical protein
MRDLATLAHAVRQVSDPLATPSDTVGRPSPERGVELPESHRVKHGALGISDGQHRGGCSENLAVGGRDEGEA